MRPIETSASRARWAAACALLFVALALAPARPASAAEGLENRFRALESSVVWERMGWDPGARAGGEIQESAVTAATELAAGRGLEARIEIARVAATRARAHLDAALRGALLVRWMPVREWLLQAGVGLPAGRNNLGPPERALATLLGDPLFAFSDPDPARGWRFHLGALRGFAVSRRMEVFLGGGMEVAASTSPAPGIRLDPGDRLLTTAAMRVTAGRSDVTARLEAALEGSDRSAGEVLRRKRTLLSGAIGARTALAGLYGSAAVEGQFCNRLSLIDPALLGARMSGGPGFFARLAAEFGLDRPLAWPGALGLRPALGVSYGRLFPNGLPAGEGWTAWIVPRLALVLPAGELQLNGGWGSGSWSEWTPGGSRPARELSGWRWGAAWVHRWGGA